MLIQTNDDNNNNKENKNTKFRRRMSNLSINFNKLFYFMFFI